jgi:class 3 adenylate cyclase/tetratricopeptide (TPR) repeat protein
MICPNCGQENPEGFRFCGACGAPLEEASAPAREERKVVTVLFADLVGFTSRSEQLDPEDVRATLSPYYTRLRSELERFGGTVEKFIGDAVMALFGAPIAHEDDPERAVRAALAIREWVAEDQAGLQLRIAVNTGEALITLGVRPSEGEGMAAGDVVNTAARLQSAAPLNGILVGESTYRATRDAIDYREAEPVEAKGKSERIPVWEALQVHSRYGEDVELRPSTPLVGRQRELDLLADALSRSRAERASQLVTLVGAPGIGKSRLLAELTRIVDADPDLIWWRQGRSLPYGEGISFWALAEIAKAQAGILETDTGDQARQKLHETVGILLEGTAEADWVEGHLRPLVGLGGDPEVRDDRRSEAFAAWRLFFEKLAESRPLVLVFEDLHWADEGLLDFVDHLVDWASGVPILVVCTARPELLERRPGWGGGKRNASTVSLSPLSNEETARLVAALLDRALLPAEVQTPLLEHAEGNPLYAVEYARAFTEQGSVDELVMPETLQGLISARLDSLSGEEKELVQSASVVGKVFWSGALAAVGDQNRFEVEELLHGLERKEFIRRERRSSVEGETQYAFLHLLVRDVAYGQIPRGRRAEKHRLVAEWIDSLAPDRSEDRAEMLAHHYLEALELAGAAGLETAALAGPARIALRDAGDRAAALGAEVAAARFYSKALELWPGDDVERPELLFRRARLHRGDEGTVELLSEAREALLEVGDLETAAAAGAELSRGYWVLGRRELAYEHLDAALALLESAPLTPVKLSVLSTRARFHMLADENEEAIQIAQEVLPAAEGPGLTLLRSIVLNTLGTARVKVGDRGGFEDLERAVETAIEANSPDAIHTALNNLMNMHWELGELERAAPYGAEMRRWDERFGSPNLLRWAKGEEVIERYLTGDWRRSEALASEFIAELEQEGSSHYLEIPCRIFRSLIRLGAGNMTGADEDSRLGLEGAHEAADFQVLAPSLFLRARILIARAEMRAAGELIDELRDLSGPGRDLGLDASAPELAWVLHDLGRGEELSEFVGVSGVETPWRQACVAITAGDFERAADVLGTIGARGHEAYARLRAAGKLVGEGRRAEADAQLQSALGFFRAVGAIAYLGEGENLLAATA